jgi:hypothetical protein
MKRASPFLVLAVLTTGCAPSPYSVAPLYSGAPNVYAFVRVNAQSGEMIFCRGEAALSTALAIGPMCQPVTTPPP